jgi:hypothetical protein
MGTNDNGQTVQSDDLLAMQLLDAVSIAAHLSKDIRDGESLVAWVKRAVRERETARAAFERVMSLGQCTTEQTGRRLTDCQNVAWEWLQVNAPAHGREAYPTACINKKGAP